MINKALPKEWRKVKLGDAINIVGGGTPKTGVSKYWGGCIPWLTPSDFVNCNRWVEKSKRTITNLGLSNSSTKVLQSGDLIFSARGTVGAVAQLQKSMAFSQTSYGIKSKQGIVITDFLFYFFRYNRKKIKDVSYGATFNTVTTKTFNEIRIFLPPLSEQKAIVRVLETWDKAIEKTETLISVKEKKFKWLLKTLISDQQNNPSWKKVKLENILNYEQPTKYIVNSTEYNNHYKVPVLTAGKTFILGYTNEVEGIFPKKKLPTIIFDDFTTAKQFVDFPFKVKSSAMKILIPKEEIADIKFIFYSIKNIQFQVKSHKRFWISQYSQIKIPIPSLSEQKRIVKIISVYEKELKILKTLIKKYQIQKAGLMQKLLTGKWRLKI